MEWRGCEKLRVEGVTSAGEFVDYYGGNLTPTQIASRISESIDSFQP